MTEPTAPSRVKEPGHRRPTSEVGVEALRDVRRRLLGESAPWTGTVQLGAYTLEYRNPRAFAWTASLIFGDGVYDVDPDALAGYPQAPVLDGGGWLGLSVLRWRELFPDAPIIVFEPDPELFEVLCRNLERNRIGNVEPVRAALASGEEDRTFQSTGSDSGSLTSLGSRTTMSVPTTQLSRFVQDPTAVVKLNIEGAEAEVVAELGERLRHVDQLLIEYHGFAELPQTLHDILGALHRAGLVYVVSHINGDNVNAVPPLSLDPTFRYFLLIYARRLGLRGGDI